ncbi:MAG: hypothetical protein KJ864_05155 [Candidatus Omnitrophica bacterium]|nr:hypothetical protein [Candidatus Omnitrophota bacterium]
MRKIQEILRLHYGETKLSNRQIANSLKISRPTVKNCLVRFEASGVKWPLPDNITTQNLYNQLYSTTTVKSKRTIPDWEKIQQEFARPNVTLRLLWEEYKETYPNGFEKSQFYEHYRRYVKANKPPSMHIDHKGGDKLFIDYSGKKLSYINKLTGEIVPVELFACSWGASSYSYTEATHSQKIPDWIQSHIRAFRYFGCTCSRQHKIRRN